MTGASGAAVTLRGIPTVPGVAAAPVIRRGISGRQTVDRPTVAMSERRGEIERLRTAAALVVQRMRDRSKIAIGPAAEVLAADAAAAEDGAWLSSAERLIADGASAPAAILAATAQFTTLLATLGVSGDLIADLNNVRDRVVAELLGVPEPGITMPAEPSILLADDLTPADAADLDPELIVGLATSLGGPTSHTATLARQLGIPCVVAVSGLDEVPVGAIVLIDGGAGSVTVSPDADVVGHAVDAFRTLQAGYAAWVGPGATSDGHRVEILANVRDGRRARAARAAGAEGVGAFGTELCFLDRRSEPTIAEQARLYREVIDAFDGGKVVIRTFDAGSDKPLGFVDHPVEPNPALGVRGIRFAQRDNGILDRQLDAIAAAAAGARQRPWVTAPMVSTVAEAEAFAAKVRARDLVPGVMIEVPAAALLVERILEHVDFLSIGTNDLAQFTMAADRVSPHLAVLTDPWQPAVLRLVAATTKTAADMGRSVCVCGAGAADPLLACVLAGLGVDAVSPAVSAIPAVGATLASVTFDDCRRAAAAVLAAVDPEDARDAARELLLAGRQRLTL